MITFIGKGTNLIPDILKNYDFDKEAFLQDVKRIGMVNIAAQTPVRSGNLKRANAAEITEDNVYFHNPTDYFKYVVFGTIFMSANPYMQRGLLLGHADFVSSLIKNLRV